MTTIQTKGKCSETKEKETDEAYGNCRGKYEVNRLAQYTGEIKMIKKNWNDTAFLSKWEPIATDNAVIRKSYSDIDLSVDKGDIVAVISTSGIDEVGDVVIPKGCDLSYFRANPGVYLEHDTDGLPLGPCKWVKSYADKIVAKYNIVEDASEVHSAVAKLVKAGAYRSHSIGFRSRNPSPPTSQEKRFHPEWETAKRIHRDTVLNEFSLVGKPCNREAVALAIGKGYSEKTLKLLSGEKKGTVSEVVEIAIVEVQKPTRKEFGECISEVAKRLSVELDVNKVVEAAIKRLRK